MVWTLIDSSIHRFAFGEALGYSKARIYVYSIQAKMSGFNMTSSFCD